MNEKIDMNINVPQTFDLSCQAFALLNQVRAQTVRARIYRTGEYFGVVPVRLANGRLAFPNTQVLKARQG